MDEVEECLKVWGSLSLVSCFCKYKGLKNSLSTGFYFEHWQYKILLSEDKLSLKELTQTCIQEISQIRLSESVPVIKKQQRQESLCNRLTQQTIKKTCCTSGAAAGVAASAGGAAGVAAAAAAASPPDAAGVAVVVVVVVVVVGAVTFSRPGMEDSWKHLEDWKTIDIINFFTTDSTLYRLLSRSEQGTNFRLHKGHKHLNHHHF